MLISEFSARRAHGYLDLAVTFNPDLTFLTGINGSGKTTVVRGLIALLTPSFRSLADTLHDEMSVVIEHDGQKVIISSTRAEQDFTLRCSAVNEELRVPVFRQAEFESPNRFHEKESEFYREQHTVNARHPLLEFLNALPTPMFLDLDRRGQAPARRARFLGNREILGPGRVPFAGTLGEGLADAQQMAEAAFDEFRSQQQKLTEDLRRDLILAAFAQSAGSSRGTSIKLPSRDYLARLQTDQQLVTSALLNLGIPEMFLERTVNGFFETLRQVASVLVDKDLAKLLKSSDTADFEILSRWVAIQPQESHIRAIVGLVERYNGEVQNAYAPFKRYLDSVNRFLSDSGKELVFSRPGRLLVSLANGQRKGIAALSSGERQLVVILTHLAFNTQATAANVLIVDEPEISLHVRWQEEFVDAAMQARQNVQLILATHSPSIILDRITYCVDVSKGTK